MPLTKSDGVSKGLMDLMDLIDQSSSNSHHRAGSKRVLCVAGTRRAQHH
jgi:hypothetical protein